MALVTCPECNQQISTDAQSCPHCGKPVAGIPSTLTPGSALFASGSQPGPEQTLWEGRPSLALVFGKLLSVIIRCLVFFAIGYFALAVGLPSLASLSSGMQSLVE